MRGHSLAIANHSTSHLAWQLTGWSPVRVSTLDTVGDNVEVRAWPTVIRLGVCVSD
jgi:hypothetical protein